VTEESQGAMDKAKGLIKEAAGTVTGKEDMKAEGRSERGAAEGTKEYFRSVIEESNKRSVGEA
jgi:uncharacterized protein YjbJ (UPF0337 family)